MLEHSQSHTIDIREVRAVRLKKLRGLANMSRREFSRFSGIKESTLQNWEAPRHGGLTEQGAQKLVECFRDLHVYFDIDWIMYGKGKAPEKQEKIAANAPVNKEKSTLKDEVKFMKSSYEDAVIFRVSDDSMMPVVPEGTVVMGRRIPPSQYPSVNNQLCICLTEGGELLFRHVRHSHEVGRYDLLLLNSISASKQISMYGRKLSMIAPVFWFRYEKAPSI